MTIKSKYRYFLTLFLVIGHFCIYAQNALIQKADTKYYNFDFYSALRLYKKAASSGVSEYYASVQAANCYKALNQPAEAIQWFNKALKFPGADNTLHLAIAQELKKTNRNNEASAHLNEYFSLRYMLTNRQDFNYDSFIRQIDRDSLSVKIEQTGINTSESEFGPILIDNTLYFSSNRPVRGFAQVKDNRTNLTFYSLYKSRLLSDSIIETPKAMVYKNSQKTNDGSACYDPSTGIFYLTQNRISNTKGRTTLTINTFITDSNIKLDRPLGQLPFAQEQYSIAHPTLSNDGRYLYFASNMPDGYGGWDIYRCEIKNGFYSKPINLGPLINTPGNETFPFIASDDNLYFSSDGHPGKGGLDILIAINYDNEFITVVNPGKPINTESDDFAIAIDSSMKFGYLSSNRAMGMGNDDIYKLIFKAPASYTIVKGDVFTGDETFKEPNVMIRVTDKNGATVLETSTDENGQYLIALKSSESYELILTKRLAGSQSVFLARPDLTNQKIIIANVKF